MTTGILVAGLIGLAVAVHQAAADSGGIHLPSIPTLIVAYVAIRCGLWCSGRAWSELLGGHVDRGFAMKAFYDSQLVKYLPAGGFVQAISQVALVTTESTTAASASLAYALLAVATVAAGLALSAILLVAPGVELWVRFAGAGALVGAVVLIYRGTLNVALSLARRLLHRISIPDQLPSQRVLNRSLMWCLANHVLQTFSFVLLLRSSQGTVPIAAMIGAYVLAWTIGFLALPLPSGIGIREAVLVAIVPVASTADILTASLAQRVVTIVAEASAALGVRVMVQLAKRRSPADNGNVPGHDANP